MLRREHESDLDPFERSMYGQIEWNQSRYSFVRVLRIGAEATVVVLAIALVCVMLTRFGG